jgi:hypothetical protein
MVLLRRFAQAIIAVSPLLGVFGGVAVLALARQLAVNHLARAFGGILFRVIELE